MPKLTTNQNTEISGVLSHSGTSMASPFPLGPGAVMKDGMGRCEEPEANANQTKQCLLDKTGLPNHEFTGTGEVITMPEQDQPVNISSSIMMER